MSYGITFNGKHSYKDFGLILEYFKPQLPQPKKIIESVPFMNGDGYDFSTVATNGEIIYTGRNILCKLSFLERSKEALYVKYNLIAAWLLESGTAQLIADAMPDFYFTAEVRELPTWDEVNKVGKLEFMFRADPFKLGINYEGSDIWNTFNFESDVAQEVEFDISGSKTITIENVGRIVVPTVNCSSNMTVTNNGYTANFVTGNNKNWSFKLKPGTNTITINGTGHIKFIYRKELI